jgi:chitodextrinase
MNLLRVSTAATEAVRAVCPIHGISFVSISDKATWRIDFKEEATEGQKAAAQSALEAFDPATVDADEARQADIEAAIQGDSTVAALKAMTNAEFDTWWAANVTNAAQAINVLKRVTRVVIRRVL